MTYKAMQQAARQAIQRTLIRGGDTSNASSAAADEGRPKVYNSILEHPQFWIFACFGILVFFLHVFLVTELYNDDVWFADLWNADQFNLVKWLFTERYLSWSSRVLIEYVLIWLCRLPLVVFWIVDSLVMVVAVKLMASLFAPDGHGAFTSLLICLGFFFIPFHLYTGVGWIAGTLNYIWPMAALLAALLAMKKIGRAQPLRWYETVAVLVGAVFATQSEQTAVVLFVAAVCFAIWGVKKKTMHWFSVVLLLIAAAGIVSILTCPGNVVRIESETARWFPEYSGIGFLGKIDLAFRVVSWHYYYTLPVPGVLLSLFLLYLTGQKYRDWVPCLPSFASLILTLTIVVLCRCTNVLSFLSTGIIDRLTGTQLLLCGIIFLSYCLLLFDVWLLLGNNMRAVIGIGILLFGFATQAMLGFSPTVWASGERTGLFMFFSVIAEMVYLLQEWNWRDKVGNGIILGGSILLACGIISYELLMYSPYLTFPSCS